MADTKRATCALTVTASGNMLTPVFVFKGNMSWLIVLLTTCFSPSPFFWFRKAQWEDCQTRVSHVSSRDNICMSRQCMDGREGDADVG